MLKFICYILLVLLPSNPALSQSKPNKIQAIVETIKKIYKDEANDYITDGEKIVFVKSYKRWVPNDLTVVKKYDPDTIQFLCNAYKHNRIDILKQLMPNYYVSHGGITAFAEDALKQLQATSPKAN